MSGIIGNNERKCHPGETLAANRYSYVRAIREFLSKPHSVAILQHHSCSFNGDDIPPNNISHQHLVMRKGNLEQSQIRLLWHPRKVSDEFEAYDTATYSRP